MVSTLSRSLLFCVIRHEWRVLIKDGILWLMIIIFSALVIYGTVSGYLRIKQKDLEHVDLLHAQEKQQIELIKQMHEIYSGAKQPDLYLRADSPSWVGGSLGAQFANMPTSPLAPLALGQSDLLADSYKVSGYDKTTFIFQDPLHNPWHLLDGHFDNAFVIVYLLPLFIILLNYNLISAERENGTLKLTLSGTLSLSILIVGKLLTRVILFLPLAVFLPLLLFAFLRGQISSVVTELILYILVTCAYLIFWCALCTWINTWGKSSSVNGLILFSLWVTLVLVVPVILNVFVSWCYPIPSRVALLTQVRDLIFEERKIHGAMNTEDYHPELKKMEPGKVFIQGYQKLSWQTQKKLKPVTDSLLHEFDLQLHKQQDCVDNYRFISPAIVIYEALTDLAGTNVHRHRHFIQQVNRFHDQIQLFFFPLIETETRLTDAHYDAMPHFQWLEEDRRAANRRVVFGIFGITLPVLLLLVDIRRKLNYLVLD